MAAATVPKGSRTIRNNIHNTLASPYAFKTHWVQLPNDVESEILNSLERLFTDLPPLTSGRRPGRQSETGNNDQENDQSRTLVKALRSLIVNGINQVTKGLEKGQLDAVVLNKPNSGEAVLTDHLKVLSATRNIPVCVLPGLKERLRKPLNIRCVSVIGFKKTSQCPSNLPQAAYQKILSLVKRIKEATSIVVLPWLHTEDELMAKAEELTGIMFPHGANKITSADLPGVRVAKSNSSTKRKLEESSETTKRAKLEHILESPFTSEGSTVSEKKKNATMPIKQSVKYQTANIMHIIKGDKKNKKLRKKQQARK